MQRTKPANSRRLFPFERIFDAADGILNLALDLVGLALRLQLCVTDRVADRLLYRAFDLLSRATPWRPETEFRGVRPLIKLAVGAKLRPEKTVADSERAG